MKKAAMNRRKRLDAPSKQETRERYENALRQNLKEVKSSTEHLSSTSELSKRAREDFDRDNQGQSSDLRDKIPNLSRTIAGNEETGSLVVNVSKVGSSAPLSLVDPSYGDNRTSIEMFDYSHKRSDMATLGENDDDDLRSLIEKQRKDEKLNEVIAKKDNKNKIKSGSVFLDSMLGYDREQSKVKTTTSDYWDSKRKENKESKSSSGKSERHIKHEKKLEESKYKSKKIKGESPSSFELGIPFFSGRVKNDDSPEKEMDINETVKELAYLRSIQTGDNALPKEEEEYFRKLNDLSKTSITSPLDLVIIGKGDGKHRQTSAEKKEGGRKSSAGSLGQIESRWESVIDNMLGAHSVGKMSVDTSGDETTYGPSLPPKKPSLTSRKNPHSNSSDWNFSSEKSSSKSNSEKEMLPLAGRGFSGGRGYRGKGSFRGRGRGRSRGVIVEGIRGGGRSRGGFMRGGHIPNRGRHIFSPEGSSRRRSRSKSSSRSRSRSQSRSHGRNRNKSRRRSSSRSNYSSSYSRSRSRSRSRDRDNDKRKSRHRSKNYNSSRSRSRSHGRSRSRSKDDYKRQRKVKEASQSKSRKRKERSRSWSFDEDYTNKNKGTSDKKVAKASADSKDKANKESEISSKPKIETDLQKTKVKHAKEQETKPLQKSQGKTKTTTTKTTGNTEEKAASQKPKPEASSSTPVVALKEFKVTAFPNVFLPRTVTRKVGNITKGISIGMGRPLPFKSHPVFDTNEEDLKEEPEKTNSKEKEKIKEDKSKFYKEVDKVFNTDSQSRESKKQRGSWTRVWPEESPKKEETELDKELELDKAKDNEKKVNQDKITAETKDQVDNKKSEKEQKKEKKEKRKKEKEEKNKRKKEKKEKKEKNTKDSENEDSSGNNSKETLGLNKNKVRLEQVNREEYESFAGYSESYQEYPEGEFQYYDEEGQEQEQEQEQGWYDDNGEYHAYSEDYIYYYDQEGNIVGYEGPEGYVEGNPFQADENYVYDKDEYFYQGQVEVEEHPEVYGQDTYGTQYAEEQSYQHGAAAEESYDYPGGAPETDQYTEDASQWEGYPTEMSEQQWHGTETSYVGGGEGDTEYPYAEAQEGYLYPRAVKQADSLPQDANYRTHEVERSQANVGPRQVAEEPKMEEDLSESEIVAVLGKNLAALARLKGWDQAGLLSKDPMILTQLLQKPATATDTQEETEPMEENKDYQEDRNLDEIESMKFQQDEPMSQYWEEQKNEGQASSFHEARAVEQKPLKSILKKGNNVSLKPPPKGEASALSTLVKSEPSSATSSDHVGHEYIVCISRSGPERFFCKLCQCHVESQMVKELHVKSMKHIELFVREKSSLLHSVIKDKPADDTGKPQEDQAIDKHPDNQAKFGLSSLRGKPPQKREETMPLSIVDSHDYHHRGRKSEDRDVPEEDAGRNRLLDYDRLRLRGWYKRDGGGSSFESEKPRQFEYGRIHDHESMEQRQYEERRQHTRYPMSEDRSPDLKREEPSGYGQGHQLYFSDNREKDHEKADYQRERQPLSLDSERQDGRGSVRARSNEWSLEGREEFRFKHQGSNRDPPITYKSRMEQDIRTRPKEDEFNSIPVQERAGLNKGGGLKSRGREREHKEPPSQQVPSPGVDRNARSRQTSNQEERATSCKDTTLSHKGREGIPPQKNRGQDTTSQESLDKTDRTLDLRGQNQSLSYRDGASIEPLRVGSTDQSRGRRIDQSIKHTGNVSHPSSTKERNQGQISTRESTTKDCDNKRNTGTSLSGDGDSSQKPTHKPSGRVGIKPLPARMQNEKEVQDGKRIAQELQREKIPVIADGKPPPALLLEDHTIQDTQKQKPQEPAKSSSTVFQGQQRVPPPPPPYSKGSGPQSFRGRGHPKQPRGRGAPNPRMPLTQPGMIRNRAPQSTLLSVPSQLAGTVTSSMAQPISGGRGSGSYSSTPFFGIGGAKGQPRFHGRGGSPRMSLGGRGGLPPFASRGRGGGRGFQRW